jgi:hypothetical protein
MTSLLQLARRPARAESNDDNDNTTLAHRYEPLPCAQDVDIAIATPCLSISDETEATTLSKRPRPTFDSLPPEIHLLIARHLIYPDALSLKHTNGYFYHLVDTGVRLKVEWLMERRLLHLDCPSNQRCDLGSDLKFCRGSVKYVSPFTDLLLVLVIFLATMPFLNDMVIRGTIANR